MGDLFTRYLGGDWIERHDDPSLWNGILAIPDHELWKCRQTVRRYLFTFVRERARQRWIEEHVGIPRVVAAGTLLEPEALTLGFARRFTGYKRPELVFHNPERLARILNASGRPVQIIFAGKAHPADDVGKHHLQRVYKRALDPLFGGRIAFVDDYDLHVAHFLEQEIVPAFYDRDASNVPHRWVAVVKEAIRTVAPRFSARRMVKEYTDRMYAPALERRAVAK
jgi:starch phosphorylase